MFPQSVAQTDCTNRFYGQENVEGSSVNSDTFAQKSADDSQILPYLKKSRISLFVIKIQYNE